MIDLNVEVSLVLDLKTPPDWFINPDGLNQAIRKTVEAWLSIYAAQMFGPHVQVNITYLGEPSNDKRT